MSGGVRNLRAMFENKDPAPGPPDRGRSPGESTISGGASTGTSPRPLSKVRTSFVTVEKGGHAGAQMGIKRQDTGEGSTSKRRTSFSIDEEAQPKDITEKKPSIGKELETNKESTMIKEVVPETRVEKLPKEAEKKLRTVVADDSKKETVKTVPKVEEKKPALIKTAPTSHTNGSSKPATTSKPVEKASSSKPISKPTPISTARTTTAAKPSPSKTKSPHIKTPTTPRAHLKETKAADKAPEKKTSRASLVSQPASRPSTATAQGSAPKTRIQPSPPQTGFHKPRPKSPTRPIKLPASLTAHTASSGSKTAAVPSTTGRKSLSRSSGNSQPTSSLQPNPTTSRSPSRTSTAATSKSALTKKPSTLKTGSSRPSLGPPPATVKKQTSRPSLALQSAPADEGFLARMMRPTTASASKTAEKSPTTPPKKATLLNRPVTRDGPPKLHDTPKASPTAHKPAEASSSKTVAEKVKAAVKAAPEKVAAAVTPKSKEEPKSAAPEPTVTEKEVAKISTAPVESKAVGPRTPVVQPPTPIQETKVEEAPKTEELKDIKDVVTPEALKDPIVETPVESKEPEKSVTPSLAEESAVNVLAVKEDASIVHEEPKDLVSVVEEPQSSKEVHVEPESKPETLPLREEPAIAEPVSQPEVVKTEVVKPELVEDPEDVRAREEIAKLNAELGINSAEEERL